jgi:hypothetical protein
MQESGKGTNAKSSNVRATAAFGAEGDIIPRSLHRAGISGAPARSVDRAAGRQRVGQLADLVVALARKPKRILRIGQDRIDARLQSCELAIDSIEQLCSHTLGQVLPMSVHRGEAVMPTSRSK